MSTTDMQVRADQSAELSVAEVVRRSDLIQQVLKQVMVPGHHFGVIPGTESRPGEKQRPPVLLKPGAEKLCMLFRLAPSFDVRTKDLPNSHREERVTCTLTHIPSGTVVAQAAGSCSTMESKYRYRNAKQKCPECDAEAIYKSKKASQPGFYCYSKVGGCGAQFGPKDTRITNQKPGKAENPDIADQLNTVLKMAEKRALVAATLLATAASDMFVVEEEAPSAAEEDNPGEAGTDEPPPEKKQTQPQLSPQEVLARDCAAMATRVGWTKDGLWRAMADHGIEPPEGALSELAVRDLKRLLGILQAVEREGKEGAAAQ